MKLSNLNTLVISLILSSTVLAAQDSYSTLKCSLKDVNAAESKIVELPVTKLNRMPISGGVSYLSTVLKDFPTDKIAGLDALKKIDLNFYPSINQFQLRFLSNKGESKLYKIASVKVGFGLGNENNFMKGFQTTIKDQNLNQKVQLTCVAY